jgi:glycosyltransferase involved in cell wall biosynthesis
MQPEPIGQAFRTRPGRVLFVTTAIDKTGAGLFEAVSGLATRLANKSGTAVGLVSAAGKPLTETERAAWQRVRVISEVSHSRLSAAISMRKLLSNVAANEYDIIHAHGIWDGASVAAANWADRNRKPFVLSPHGMLEPWSLGHHKIKKAVPWLAWERAAIGSATVIETKSRMEACNVRRLGFRNPLAVIPIAIDGPPAAVRQPGSTAHRTCLFLSRIHPKKGVELLIRAWSALKPEGWRLVIAGPDGGVYQRFLENMVRSLNLEKVVTFSGPAYGDVKWKLFQAADLFCLPSYSENFGIVVIEALSQNTPVVTTSMTPWNELALRGCGWQVEPTWPGIERALAQAFSLPPVRLAEMGQNGYRYVDECFRWEVITRDTLNMYAWACGGGLPPRCLDFGVSGQANQD